MENELSEQRQNFDYKSSLASASTRPGAATIISANIKSNIPGGQVKIALPKSKLSSSDNDEQREMLQLRQILEAKTPSVSTLEQIDKANKLPTRDTGASSSGGQGAPRFYSERPQRVVKRITRSMTPEGDEYITVQYIVSDSEVVRVEREQNRRQRDLLKLSEGVSTTAPRGRPSMQTVLSRGARVPAKKRTASDAMQKGGGEDDEGDFDTYEDPGAIVLKLRKTSKSVSPQ